MLNDLKKMENRSDLFMKTALVANVQKSEPPLTGYPVILAPLPAYGNSTVNDGWRCLTRMVPEVNPFTIRQLHFFAIPARYKDAYFS